MSNQIETKTGAEKTAAPIALLVAGPCANEACGCGPNCSCGDACDCTPDKRCTDA